MKLMFLPLLLMICTAGAAQSLSGRVVLVDSGRDCSVRGMSIPGNDVIWLSGSKGQVARSADGGRTWTWQVVEGFESTDFRDIHAFDSARAIIMGIGNPALILKTTDGGRHWKTVFTKAAPGMFLDAMDFSGSAGICIGDPLDLGGARRFFVIRSRDEGETWQEDAIGLRPAADTGEAVFSASGSNIALLDGGGYAFISGGMRSNLYLVSGSGAGAVRYPVPVVNGSESSGAFSMATDRKSTFYCIGGDYKNPGAARDVFAWTSDRGRSWKHAQVSQPTGYRSCIRMISDGRLIACGTNGVDMRIKRGVWQRISDAGFNVCAQTPDGTRVFFAGAKGRVGVLEL